MTPDQIATAGRLLTGSGWQTGLAERLGVSRASVTSWLTGRRTVPGSLRDDVAAALDALIADAEALRQELKE